MRIGCHISIRHGYLAAAKTALAIGASAFQYFPKNPRSLSVKAFSSSDAQACAAFCQEHNIASIAHTPYPTNLAVEDPKLRQVTLQSVLNDLEITEACGSVGLVVHFGKFKGPDLLQGYRNNQARCLGVAFPPSRRPSTARWQTHGRCQTRTRASAAH